MELRYLLINETCSHACEFSLNSHTKSNFEAHVNPENEDFPTGDFVCVKVFHLVITEVEVELSTP